jgi:hypothetical protein
LLKKTPADIIIIKNIYICSYVKIKKSMVYNKKIKLFFNQFILTGLVVKYRKNNLRKRRTKEVAH